MMAKMFYTLEETKAALQKNEEEIKQLAREGRLREFRDGPRLMFKADQVESIKNELGLGGGGGGGDMGISDTGAPIGLVDSRSASATGISLSDTDPGARSGSASGIALAGGSSMGSGMPLKDDTALAADLGLSGSMGGVPSPGRPGSSGLTGTAAGRSGISIFGGEEGGEVADPSAQTNIASNVPDQVSLESVGSGSGLLDLTRESDDTSLGAELLDEIAPGTGSKAGSRGPGGSGTRAGTGLAGTRAGGTAVAEPAITGGRAGVAGPVMIETPDPMAPAFAGACLGASVFVIFGGLALMGAVLGAKVPLVSMVQEKNLSLLALAGIGVGVSLLFFVVGLVAGKR
jgi:hypothetical protein